MRLLSRTIFREVFTSAFLGTVLFTFILFLQKVKSLFELILRSSAPPKTLAYLFALLLPPALIFTIPVGVLIGVLIALSRMSSDGEITAMRAAGIPSRSVAPPVIFFGLLCMALTASASLFIAPFSIRETYRILNKLTAEELTANIQDHVFEEGFPNTILYVDEILPGPIPRWRGVFIADLTTPGERKNRTDEAGDAPRITMATEATPLPDIQKNRIQLALKNVSSYEVGKSSASYIHNEYPAGDELLDVKKKNEITPSRPFEQYSFGELRKAARTDIEARIEFHRRLALPIACLILALVGIPLGVSSRKGGKSGAFVLTVVLALSYYTGLITVIGLARQKALPVEVALWLPNLLFSAFGLLFLSRLERPGDRDWIGSVREFIGLGWRRLSGTLNQAGKQGASAFWERIPLLGQIIDGYILRGFLFYFAMLLFSFVAIFEVFTFFELLSDIVRNHTAMARVVEYLVFLSPQLIYDSTPMSVQVAILVTFGILTKQNEITAFKACGISLYRLAVPILLVCSFLSVALFAFDHYVVPDANRRQDAIRAEIKGKKPQTYLRPDRPWTFGRGSRIYYYQYFDANQAEMSNVSVYEFDPAKFSLRRHISAERAKWDPDRKCWVFRNGWARSFEQRHEIFQDFQGNGTAVFGGLDEPPSYFLKEEKLYTQMNFQELGRYIGELQQSGFDTIRLRVQLYRKFAVPLFALIMAMISIPFSFLTGNRGAMAGVGISFGIAIAYWSISQLFQQVGNLSQLPAVMAAWSPDVLFALAGSYLLLRMRT